MLVGTDFIITFVKHLTNEGNNTKHSKIKLSSLKV
jgi:hypothetical protein